MPSMHAWSSIVTISKASKQMAASILFLLLLLFPLAHNKGLIVAGQPNDGDQQPQVDSLRPFIFNLGVGTSPQTLSVVMDITSDLVWVQCERCTSCTRNTPPGTPTFLPRNSSSYALVGCDTQICDHMLPPAVGDHTCLQGDNLCEYVKPYYGTGSTSGFLATETFSFGSTKPVQGVVFGCSDDITVPDLDGASGYAGFSRGPLSLVSQLKISSFTYFIAPPGDPADEKNASASGYLSWSSGAGGDYTALQTAATTGGGRSSSSSTPLLPAAENQTSYLYYVNLTGVQVDDKLLTAIPAGTFDVRANGSGGVYLSTTLAFTYLDKAAYDVLKPELVGRIKSQGVFPVNAADGGDLDDELCFLTQDLAKAKVPKVSLLFDGADAAMELKEENYFLADDGGKTCLTILPAAAATGSVLGSQLQAGRKMTYDIYGTGDGRLTFETAAAAGAPVPERASLVVMAAILMWVLGSQTLL